MLMAESPMYNVICAMIFQKAFEHLLLEDPALLEDGNMSAIQGKPMGEVFTRERQLDSATTKKEENTAESTKYLRIALRLVGLTFIFGIYTFCLVWPSGWAWHAGPMPHYLQMILGVYATLGVFLLIASRNPLAHSSLIWFTVWSSVVHAGIMGAQALANPEHIAHLWGDVPALLAVAGILALLTRRAARTQGRL